jgi:hypothetical protein
MANCSSTDQSRLARGQTRDRGRIAAAAALISESGVGVLPSWRLMADSVACGKGNQNHQAGMAKKEEEARHCVVVHVYGPLEPETTGRRPHAISRTRVFHRLNMSCAVRCLGMWWCLDNT